MCGLESHFYVKSLPHTNHTHTHTVKLVVTTLPRSSPSSGPVVVETIQGGVGVSSIMFTFVDPNAQKGPGVGISDSHSPFVRKKTKTSILGE